MLKILIVDDEALIRQGLTTRLKAIRPDTETREAQGGREALDILKNWRAQLVIADIEMPGMDGLSLIAAVRENDPDMQFIILTGYAEFAYARRALQLGVQEYLLKPISTRELSDALTRVAQRVKSDQSAKSTGAEITHLKSRLNSIDLQQNFYKLIGSPTLGEEEAAALRAQVFPGRKTPLMLALMYVSGASRRAREARSLADEAAALLPDFTESDAPYLFPHYMNPSRMLYFVFPCPDGKGKAAVASLERVIAQFTARGAQATAGVADVTEHIGRAENGAAVAALQRRLLYGAGRVYARGAEASHEVSRQLSQDLSDLQAALLISDSAGAENVLSRVFSPEHVPDAPQNYLWTAYLHVMSALSLSTSLQSPGLDSSLLDSFDTREEFLQYVKMLPRSILAPRGSAESKRNERIQHAIEYVRRHFNEDLTLNGLSYQYALSPNYFSSVFKEATGMGVVNFLTGVRIENACYMLTHTDLSVGGIAHQVGYADAQYFFQVFKKNVGVTPVQYRKQHADEGDDDVKD